MASPELHDHSHQMISVVDKAVLQPMVAALHRYVSPRLPYVIVGGGHNLGLLLVVGTGNSKGPSRYYFHMSTGMTDSG